MPQEFFEEIIKMPLSLGANKANIITTDKITFDKYFREICVSNACGMYGKCWMCPPSVGDIFELMGEVKKYDYILVYQTVGILEDSYDFDGMMVAKRISSKLTCQVRASFKKFNMSNILVLGVGGCGICDVCSKSEDKSCRFPELAIPSLEAYGINVSLLAKEAKMKYINGENTVTYFGAVLFNI